MLRFNSLQSRSLFAAAKGALAICSLILFLAPAAPVRADVIRGVDSVPPMDGVYRDPAEVHADFDTGTVRILLRRPEHSRFDRSSPPPQVIGDTTTHTFGSIGVVEVSFDIGMTWQPISRQISCSVDVTYVKQVDPIRYFATQMTVFDINIAPGTRIRQSPDNPSLGATEIETLPDGNFRIGSFFDLNLELTLDDGQTWTPSSVTGHVELGEP